MPASLESTGAINPREMALHQFDEAAARLSIPEPIHRKLAHPERDTGSVVGFAEAQRLRGIYP